MTIIIDDHTGKPITPLQGLKWHVQEIKDIDKLLKDKTLSIKARKELRLYRKRLTKSQGNAIIAMNRSIGK